ncbi:MAG TPA: TonB-dependent receptor [Solimonas sp.]
MRNLCAPCLCVLLSLAAPELQAQAPGGTAPPADAATPAPTATTTGEDPGFAAELDELLDSAAAEPAEPAPATTQAEAATEAPAPPDAELPVIPLAEAAPAEPESPLKEPKYRSPQLEEIVVTATKREQLTRDIPSSMAVMSGQKLEQLGIRKVKEVFLLVPGINMQDEIAGQQRKISMRGVGPDTGTNQTVGSVMGDIPISDPYGATTIVDPNPWDMRTVEVLKGPQGSLFGATSLAGLIRYVPNAPELGVWQGKAFYDYTTVDEGGSAPTFGGALNVPLGDTLAFRFAGIRQQLPGVIDSENPSRREEDIDTGQSWSGRAMALWKPTEEFSATAWYTKEQRSSDDLYLVTFREPKYVRYDVPEASPTRNGFSLATLDLRYSFDWATLVSITGYQQKNSYNDIDASNLVQPLARAGLSFLHAERDVKTHGLAQELRLLSPDDGKLTWLVGLYYSGFKQAILSRLYIPGTEGLAALAELIPLPPLESLLTDRGITLTSTGYDPLTADERALYGEANYDFTDSFRVTLGSRLYETTVEGTLKGSGLASQNDGTELGTTEKGWSPKLAITWRPRDNVMVYANVARGFQFGGFNLPLTPGANVPLTFESSSLWNYEAGVRTDWFDGSLRLDLTAFFLDWKNPQIKQTANSVNQYVDNVGGTHNIGVETTIAWATPIEGLTIEQAASYIEARTTETFDDVSGEQIPKGTLMPSAPRVQSVTTLSYARPIGPWRAQVSLINSFQDKAYADILHRVEVGNFNILGLNFGVSRDDGDWKPALTLSVNNLTNVQALVAGFEPPPGLQQQLSNIVGNSSYVYTQPRSIVLRASVEF